jgi:hypothetical protein
LPGRKWLALIGQYLCWNDAKGRNLERAFTEQNLLIDWRSLQRPASNQS